MKSSQKIISDFKSNITLNSETERPRVRTSPASLHCGPWARHIYSSLVLLQSRKNRPCLTKRLLMGRIKESNQTNQNFEFNSHALVYPHSVGPEVYGICACTFFWDCTSTDKLFVQGGRLETVSRFVVFVSFDYFLWNKVSALFA